MDKQYFIKKAGGVSKLAQLLAITRQTVHNWGPDVPTKYLMQIKGIKPSWFRASA